jgi:hypothetical protein
MHAASDHATCGRAVAPTYIKCISNAPPRTETSCRLQEATCPEAVWRIMTVNVEYGAICRGMAMKWFVQGARDRASHNKRFPKSSHGCSALLASIHYCHPRLAYACASSCPLSCQPTLLGLCRLAHKCADQLFGKPDTCSLVGAAQ